MLGIFEPLAEGTGSVAEDQDAEADVAVDRFMGYNVNEFTSTVTYGIFNDPDTFKIGDGIINREALEERLFKLPLMEDDNYDYVARHARLSNEDRAVNGQAERVKVRKKTILETPWSDA